MRTPWVWLPQCALGNGGGEGGWRCADRQEDTATDLRPAGVDISRGADEARGAAGNLRGE